MEPLTGTYEHQSDTLLRVAGLTKRYPGTIALDDVSFEVRRGTIHALIGQNGAGKSTLVKILSGVERPDSGSIVYDGAPLVIHSATQARGRGIATVFQELNLAPDLTALENLFLGREQRRKRWLVRIFLDNDGMSKRARALFDEFGLSSSDIERPVSELSALKKHLIVILRAMIEDSRLILLDEPTSGITEEDRRRLFDHMEALRARGVTLLWVTHSLSELSLADTVTVLRDGRQVATIPGPDASPRQLVTLMLGRAMEGASDLATAWQRDRRLRKVGDEALRIAHLSTHSLLHDVSFSVDRGEILGLAGLAGSGPNEVARALVGVERLNGGQVIVGGRECRIRSPRDALKVGIAMVPAERKTFGVFGEFDVRQNLTISCLGYCARGPMLMHSREWAMAGGYVNDLEIRCAGLHQKVGTLSGGNQQKVVIGRMVAAHPKVLIIDEPTQGVDVGARPELYRLIETFANEGGSVLVVSSDVDELVALADRVLVMRSGKVVGSVTVGGSISALDASHRIVELASWGSNPGSNAIAKTVS